MPQDSLSIRAGLIVVAITASCGLGWIVMSSLTSPSDLAWVGESKRILGAAGGSSSPAHQIINSSASITDYKAWLGAARDFRHRLAQDRGVVSEASTLEGRLRRKSRCFRSRLAGGRFAKAGRNKRQMLDIGSRKDPSTRTQTVQTGRAHDR
jgi:hypothetical protein